MDSLFNREMLTKMFTKLLINSSWAGMTFYTRMEMLWNQAYQYYTNYLADDTELIEYPFKLIKGGGENDNHFQVYYPNIEVANFKFVQVEIEFEGQKYVVDMNPYMVVGNRLFQRDFVQWLMYDAHSIDIEDDDDYTVHILDQDVNIVTVSDKEYIEIDSDNYLKKSLLD
jgi:hypothetical protein